MFENKIFKNIFCTTVVLSAAACSHNYHRNDLENRAQYWQRIDTSSAIYQRGPKAQQMLNRDIARCISQIRELERLGEIRKALPADYSTKNKASHDAQLDSWNTPERTGVLRSELEPFHDYETCMQHKGWERIKYVPYDIERESRDNYIENLKGEEYRSDYPGNPDKPASTAIGRPLND